MRIALISDIHGNLIALEAALADATRRGADRIICLGDVAVLGPQPREVIGLLSNLDVPTIMGNTDQWLLDPQTQATENQDARRQFEVELWAAEQLDEADRAAVAGYAPTLSFDFGDGFSLLCYHGSPRSFDDQIRPATPEEELDEWFSEGRALINAGGHTHEPMIRRYGASMLVNPGSVGLPVQWTADGRIVKPVWAEYALLEWESGALAIALHRVPYALDDLISAVRASAMPHGDYWLADWQQ